MSDIFSLSFSNSSFQIAHIVQDDDKAEVASLNALKYPFEFKFDQLFEPDQLITIGNIIDQQRSQANIESLSIMVSLPLNYALQKKIALPNDMDQDVIDQQVKWELSHYLPGELSDFKVIMTDSAFDFSGYKEVLFICIKKEIIKNISKLAQSCNGVLSKLIVDNMALENYLVQKQKMNPDKNQVLFNIDDLQFISHLFLGGKYYNSYAENINPLKANSYEEKVVKLAKEHFLTIKRLNEQLPFGKDKELEIIVYGQAFTNDLLDKLKDNFSGVVENFNGAEYSNLGGVEIAGYIEALGTGY